jgi:hypothetical protein
MPLVYVPGPVATIVGAVLSAEDGDLKGGPNKGQKYRRVVVQTKRSGGGEGGVQQVYVAPEHVADADPRVGDEVEWEVEFDARSFMSGGMPRVDLNCAFVSDPAAAPSTGARGGKAAAGQPF